MKSIVARLRPGAQALDERSMRLLVTAGASYLGRFGSGIAVLVTIPMARQVLAPELFGVWMMLSALLAFFGFADLGVGNGVLNRVTAARSRGDGPELRRVIVAGYCCTAVLGILVALAWGCWVLLAQRPSAIAGRVAPALDAEVVRAFTVFSLLLAVNLPGSLIQKIQLGAQNGHWVGLSQFVAACGTLVAVPAVLRLGGGVAGLVMASLGVQVMVNLGSTVIWLRRRASLWSGHAAAPVRWTVVAGLLRTGSLFFALQLAVALAYQSDAFVLTHTLGQRAYGDFAVVQRLFMFVSLVLSAGLTGLWPAFGDAVARGEMRWARRALLRALTLAFCVALVGSLMLVMSMGWLTHRWLHVNAPPPLTLTLSLGAWTVVDAMGSVSGAFMNAANVLRAQVIFAVSMATLAFAGKCLLAPLLGPPGVVIATLVAYGVTSVPGQVVIFRRIFSNRKESP
jgi:O-antigen/teichoic acid export membrane protein